LYLNYMSHFAAFAKCCYVQVLLCNADWGKTWTSFQGYCDISRFISRIWII